MLCLQNERTCLKGDTPIDSVVLSDSHQFNAAGVRDREIGNQLCEAHGLWRKFTDYRGAMEQSGHEQSLFCPLIESAALQ